eukprot:893141-Pelagomonas_calceolata.AAC.2
MAAGMSMIRCFGETKFEGTWEPPCFGLKALGIDNIMRFEWLAPPPAEAMVRALEALAALGVLDQDARCVARV